jgi:hypothetical protein
VCYSSESTGNKEKELAPKAPKVKSETITNNVTTTPQASPEEEKDRALGRGLQMLSLNEQGYLSQYDEGSKTWSFTKKPPAQMSADEQADMAMDKEMRQMAMDKLRGVVSPETKRLVGETYGAQREAGNAELDRYASSSMAARGLNASDTPALREVGLQKSAMETGLRGAEASSLLDVGQRNQMFGQAMMEFRKGLDQQAFMNKAMIGQSAFASAGGLANIRSLNQTNSGSSFQKGTGGPGGGMGVGAGMATGAMSGAMTGSMFGPWGTAIGAGVGALAGGLSGSR